VDWTATEDGVLRTSAGISDAMLQAFRTFSVMSHQNATRSSRPWNFTIKNVTIVIFMHVSLYVVPQDVLKYHRQQHKNLSHTTVWTAAEVLDFWYDITVSRWPP